MFKRFSISPQDTAISFAVLGWVGIAGILVVVVGAIVNSRDVCTRKVASKADAVAAMRDFFNSRSSAAEAMIAELRHDGMTDESFEKLKGGCSNCSIHPGSWSGNPHLELEPNRWYGSVWIAERKSIILEVNCAQDIRLWERLYGRVACIADETPPYLAAPSRNKLRSHAGYSLAHPRRRRVSSPPC